VSIPALEYVAHLDEHYRSYHDHKETLAYNAMALYVGAFGIALVTKDWPPAWAIRDPLFGFWAVTAAWLVFLLYIKWQLRKRRWAALRAAGTDRMLARWTISPPSAQELEIIKATGTREPDCWEMIVDHIWPLRAAVPVLEGDEPVYPRALVETWLTVQRNKGTSAVVNEGLLIVIGWCLYLALLARTITSGPPPLGG
jgi:hypothetical protein